MFTGIIRKISKVEKIREKDDDLFVAIEKPKNWKLRTGDSVSVDGICSTIRTTNRMDFEVDYMKETRDKTTVNEWKKGRELNLERSLRLSDLLDGHLVLGHIDGTAKIIDIKKTGKTRVFKIRLSKKLMKYIAEKGSVAIDGVSLTIAARGNDWFTVSLVSYTLENTGLKNRRIGDRVNVETDILAKYVKNI